MRFLPYEARAEIGLAFWEIWRLPNFILKLTDLYKVMLWILRFLKDLFLVHLFLRTLTNYEFKFKKSYTRIFKLWWEFIQFFFFNLWFSNAEYRTVISKSSFWINLALQKIWQNAIVVGLIFFFAPTTRSYTRPHFSRTTYNLHIITSTKFCYLTSYMSLARSVKPLTSIGLKYKSQEDQK